MTPTKSMLAAISLMAAPLTATAQETPEEIVRAVLTAVFIEPDPSVIERFVAEDYIQHNPNFPNGRDVLMGFATNPPPGFRYQIGMVIAEDNLVAVHARVEGFGPTPMILVDILRVEDGLVVEHWDVIQPEVTETVSGNPMWTPAPE